jgi:hypothetical protein
VIHRGRRVRRLPSDRASGEEITPSSADELKSIDPVLDLTRVAAARV